MRTCQLMLQLEIINVDRCGYRDTEALKLSYAYTFKRSKAKINERKQKE